MELKSPRISAEGQIEYTKYIAKNSTVTIDGRELPLAEALQVLKENQPKTRPILNIFPHFEFPNWIRRLISDK